MIHFMRLRFPTLNQ
ncbi:hypothetical protein DZB84_19250 [Bacillus sp. HNG]|nr:hypothetical protein DZB84_19250 [Bacillus sp. HNG]